MIKLPKINIAHLPTVVELLPRLSSKLNGPKIFIKRDDQTGLAFGGNKARKLEYLLADAKAHGARTLITTGAIQSNHCRQTAAAAAKFGFKCILVVTGKEPQNISGNLLLDNLFRAEIVWSDLTDRDSMLDFVFKKTWKEGQRPYLIPYGGSNEIGAVSFAAAFEELKSQINQVDNSLIQDPDWIVLATSSGGTQAGLVVGAALTGYKGKILGISVDKKQSELIPEIISLANKIGSVIHLNNQNLEALIEVNDQYLGEGYGIAGKLEIETITTFAQEEGVLLDPVYTGRAAGGMLDLINQGKFDKNETILFWHTGGTPVMFAEPYREILSKYLRTA